MVSLRERVPGQETGGPGPPRVRSLDSWTENPVSSQDTVRKDKGWSKIRTGLGAGARPDHGGPQVSGREASVTATLLQSPRAKAGTVRYFYRKRKSRLMCWGPSPEPGPTPTHGPPRPPTGALPAPLLTWACPFGGCGAGCSSVLQERGEEAGALLAHTAARIGLRKVLALAGGRGGQGAHRTRAAPPKALGSAGTSLLRRRDGSGATFTMDALSCFFNNRIVSHKHAILFSPTNTSALFY